MIKRIINKIKREWALRSNAAFCDYLRSKGVHVGKDTIFRKPRTVRIDLSRPSLISIGKNVHINLYFQILTHDFASMVFIKKHSDFVNSSGKVSIGDDVYIGTNVCVLKGVTIGDNCVIGAYSLVNKDIPANSVAGGVPCRVLCTVDELYERRKTKALDEAVEYVNSFIDRYGRNPRPDELNEEFIYYIDRDNYMDYPTAPCRQQLGEYWEAWLAKHRRTFDDYDSFINYCREHRQ